MGLGGVAGALFGGAQALVLRHHVKTSGYWVLGNALGWAIGLPVAYIAGGSGLGVAAHAVLASVLVGGAMGLSVGLCTYGALFKMRRRVNPRSS